MKNKSKEEALKKQISKLQRRINELERMITKNREIEQIRTKLNKILGFTPNAIIEQNLDGIIIRWNPGAEKIYQYTAQEILGKPFSKLIPPENKNQFSHLFARIKTGKEIDSYATEHIRKDQKKINVLMTASPIKSLDNSIVGVLTIIRDVSQLKRYEIDIIHLNEIFQAIRRINQRVIQEYNESNLLNQICDILLNIKDYKAICILYNGKKYQAGEKKYCDEIDKFMKEKKSDFQKVVSYKFDDHFLAIGPIAHGEVSGYLYIVHTRTFTEEEISLLDEICGDIAFALYEFKIEKERTKVAATLKESEEKYRILVEQSHDAIYIYRGDKFLFINNRVSEITGYTKEELLRMKIWDLIHPDERKRIKEIGMKRAQGQAVPNRYISRVVTKNGDVRFCEFSVTRITYQGHYAAMGAVRDITDWIHTQDELQRTIENTLQAMAKILETRDPYTAGHQTRVARLARAIAEEMKLSRQQINCIYSAALIHDIGKIYIPAEILSRPSVLSETEFELIKNHCQVGYEILKNIKFSGPIAEIVLQHHERLDGSGYPRGLKDKEILLEAKILAVADVVEAMSSHRPYRPAKGIKATMDEIKKNKALLYDAEIVDVCVKLFRKKGFKFEPE